MRGLVCAPPAGHRRVFAFGVGSSAIPFVVLNTLFWLPVLVFGVLERGVLKVGPQGVVWIRGVGRLSFRREVPVDAWTWGRVVVLCHFGWAVEVVGRDGQGHCVYESPYGGSAGTSDAAQADCERIRQLLSEKAGVSLARIRIETERTATAAAEAQAKISVVRDDNGRIVRIIYRPKRYVRGMVVLALVLAFFGLVGCLVWTKGESPWLFAAFAVPTMLGAVTPLLYDFLGRREIVVGEGKGRYFNGIWRIGLTRPFTFDETTRVRKGESSYYFADHGAGHADTTGTRALTKLPEVRFSPLPRQSRFVSSPTTTSPSSTNSSASSAKPFTDSRR